MWPVMRYYITGNEVLYDRFWGIIWPVLRYFYVTGNEALYDRFWGIIAMVLRYFYMTGFEVLYDRFLRELSMLNSMLPFFVIVPHFLAIFRCYCFDVPVFFSMFSYSISPSFPSLVTKHWLTHIQKESNLQIVLCLKGCL